MALKTIIAAGIAAVTMAFASGSAEAKTNIIIGIGTPGWYGGNYCYNHPYRCRPAPRPLYYNYYVNPGPVIHYNYRRPVAKMSCGRAAGLVANRFNRVAVRECSGPVYTFTGRRNGNLYIVKVDAFARRIIGASRL
jgi:hypothetical protein